MCGYTNQALPINMHQVINLQARLYQAKKIRVFFVLKLLMNI